MPIEHEEARRGWYQLLTPFCPSPPRGALLFDAVWMDFHLHRLERVLLKTDEANFHNTDLLKATTPYASPPAYVLSRLQNAMARS